MTGSKDTQARVQAFRDDVQRIRDEIGKIIVGQQQTLNEVLTCLFAGGHALLEGVPGLGKTMLVRSLSEALELDFSRVQFTPDLMPADIIGTTILVEDQAGHQAFEFRRGPIFANVVLADEVNRATPKTQSALLEVMQEHSVTVAKVTHRLEEPYLVLATQNPMEMEGTYPLPEAQLDRFLFKIHVDFPTHDELRGILERTTGSQTAALKRVIRRERLLEMRHLVRDVPAAPHVVDYVVRLLEATHPDRSTATPNVKRFVRYGASPRGAQSCLLAAKVYALVDGRFAVSVDDVRRVAKPALRHRLILSFEGEAEGVKMDTILDEILAQLKESPK